MWKLVDEKSQCKRSRATSKDLTPLNYQIHRSLRADWKARVAEAGTAIESSLDDDRLQDAWNIAKAWYRQASGIASKPSHKDRERTELYKEMVSPGDGIPIHLDMPFVIDDAPPTPAEVADACRDLKRNRTCGLSGIQVEDLQHWLKEYQKQDTTEADKEPWNIVLELVDEAFASGDLPRVLSLSLLVIIPKPSGGVHGIGLLETLWKLIEKICEKCFSQGIKFHDALHGFRKHGIKFHDTLHGFKKHRGCGTAILECRLEQERALYMDKTLFQVFLDLTKAHDTLDRKWTLKILEKYGVGPNILCLLETFWDALVLCARQGRYYSCDFIKSGRGVTQGGILSPIIFNIIVDAIVRKLLQYYSPDDLSAAFYVDDGRLASAGAIALQDAVDRVMDLFA